MILLLLAFFQIQEAHAGVTPWNFTPLTVTTITVQSYTTAVVQYSITNKVNRTVSFEYIETPTTNLNSGLGLCTNPFVLGPNQSCVLSLTVSGAETAGTKNLGPIVCAQHSNMCYKPALADQLIVTTSEI